MYSVQAQVSLQFWVLLYGSVGLLFLLEHYMKVVYCFTSEEKLRVIHESDVEELKSLS